MSKNPVNLAVRFVLEIAALAGFAVWGWHLHAALALRAFAAIAAPAAAGILWGAVATPRDVVRSTSAPIVVPGAARLAIELLVFAGAFLAMYSSGYRWLAVIYAGVVIVQNVMSWDRWQRLLVSE